MIDWPWQAWTAIIALITLHLLIGGILVRGMDRLNRAQSKADQVEKEVDAATIAIANSRSEIERIEKELVDHRVVVAREYVSNETLVSLESRIVEAINRLGDRLDKMFQVGLREHA